MAVNSSGIVYVTDRHDHRVQLFSADGKYISLFGSRGLNMVNFIIHTVSVYTPPTQCTSLIATIVFQHTLAVDSLSNTLVHDEGMERESWIVLEE